MAQKQPIGSFISSSDLPTHIILMNLLVWQHWTRAGLTTRLWSGGWRISTLKPRPRPMVPGDFLWWMVIIHTTAWNSSSLVANIELLSHAIQHIQHTSCRVLTWWSSCFWKEASPLITMPTMKRITHTRWIKPHFYLYLGLHGLKEFWKCTFGRVLRRQGSIHSMEQQYDQSRWHQALNTPPTVIYHFQYHPLWSDWCTSTII